MHRSKHLYETLYNRINSDLLMWEPAAPMPDTVNEPLSPVPDLRNVGMFESIHVPYSLAKSGINLGKLVRKSIYKKFVLIHFPILTDSNSESELESDSTYHSVYEQQRSSFKRSTTTAAAAMTTATQRCSALSLELCIGQGLLVMLTPVRDTTGNVIPGQLGEFMIKLNRTTLFSVNGYMGNLDLGYLCLHSKSIELYHFGLIPVPSATPPLRLINSIIPEYQQSTLYPTPQNVTLSEWRNVDNNREMLSLAMEIRKCCAQSVKVCD